MTKFRQSPATPKQWATELQEKVLANYDLDVINTRYNEAFKGLI